MNFYLAAPFFNPEQQSVLKSIEDRALALGIRCFSPRIECLCPPDAPAYQRKNSFEQNCHGILHSNFVLARIDDFDPGTMWELGYAFAVKRYATTTSPRLYPKLYAFTTVPSRGLNLMLAQSVDGFLQGIPSVMKFMEEIKKGVDTEAKSWNKAII